jgi:hypothetical protein
LPGPSPTSIVASKPVKSTAPLVPAHPSPFPMRTPRRWFRFSLRSGMFFVAALGLILAWPAWELRRINLRKGAMREIVDQSGMVFARDLDEFASHEMTTQARLRFWLGDVFVYHFEVPPSLQDDGRRFAHIFPEAETMTVSGTPEPSLGRRSD